MRMRIVGCHPRAGGSECVIFGHVGANHRFAPVRAEPEQPLTPRGDWSVRPMRPGSALETAPALVGSALRGEGCRTGGRPVLVSHSWSGVLQINDIARKYTIDLYSSETRLVLVDVVHEILVDVGALATIENGALALPPLPPEAIVEHIAGAGAWFRFLQRDADFDAGPVRSSLERFRRRRGEAMKLRVMAALLPNLARPAPLAVAAPPAEPTVRDELRMLTAAVEGLALRARA